MEEKTSLKNKPAGVSVRRHQAPKCSVERNYRAGKRPTGSTATLWSEV